MGKTGGITDRGCIYCGEQASGIRQGEHILQQSIGGKRTIVETSGRLVCHGCNNGVLSQLDNELCGRSYLAHIASQEIDAGLWQVWDVDHASGRQLVEARPEWVGGELKSLFCYPQLVFGLGGMGIRGDAEEASRFGNESFENVLVRAAYHAFQRFKSGAKKKGLIFEQIERDVVAQGYRYDPRVFTRHSIAEIAKGIERTSFILRYTSHADKRTALRQLDALDPHRRVKRRSQNRGSQRPPVASTFDLGQTMRGLMKIGFNILAAYCKETPVDRRAFSRVVRLIRGEDPAVPELIFANGFVPAADLAGMRAPDGGHAFRLTWLGKEWRVYSSFFGGRLAAAVSFPGPNREKWNTLHIVAPLKSKEWQVGFSPIMQPIATNAPWGGMQDLVPTIKLRNSYTGLTVEEVPFKPPRR